MSAINTVREFIKTNLNGQCKVLSLGSECKCPLCELDRIQEALDWYKEEAVAISMNMIQKRDMAVLASVEVLSLDCGKRAKNVLGD